MEHPGISGFGQFCEPSQSLQISQTSTFIHSLKVVERSFAISRYWYKDV